MNLNPRQLIDTALRERSMTLVDFALHRRLEFPFLHELYDGGYPAHAAAPPELKKIGEALGVDAQAWADLLGVGVSKLTPEAARDSLKAKLWSYLVRTGQTVADAATLHGTSFHALVLTLRNGIAGPAVRKSTVMAALGVDANAQPEDTGMRSRPSPALQELFRRAFARDQRLSVKYLFSTIGCGRETIAMLVRGEVSHMLKPIIVPQIARLIGEPLDQVAHLVAMSWRRTTGEPSAGTLRYLVARHCFKVGLPLEAFAKQAQVAMHSLFRICDGRKPTPETLANLRTVLKPTPDEWHRAISTHAVRQKADSDSYQSLKTAGVKPLNELILEAAAGKKIDPYAWGQQYGIAKRSMRGILERAYLVHSADTRGALVRALGLEQHSFHVSVRLMAEQHKPDQRGLGHITPTTGIQEHFLRLVREQGVAMEAVARSCRVDMKTIERMIRVGPTALKPATLERIRQYLGLSPHAFAAHMRVFDEGDVEDDDEIRMLAAFRKLRPDRRKQLLGMIGRLQVEVRQLTLAFRDASGVAPASSLAQ